MPKYAIDDEVMLDPALFPDHDLTGIVLVVYHVPTKTNEVNYRARPKDKLLARGSRGVRAREEYLIPASEYKGPKTGVLAGGRAREIPIPHPVATVVRYSRDGKVYVVTNVNRSKGTHTIEPLGGGDGWRGVGNAFLTVIPPEKIKIEE